MKLRFSTSTEGVDWAGLKQALSGDNFDNGRSPEQYRRSHENSAGVVFVYDGTEFVGNGRVLSDGVCNAYLVDIWTRSDHRRQGIGTEIVRRLTQPRAGQHVGLFTDDQPDFYAALGFRLRPHFMERVEGTWLQG